jgi:hypothetical protein
MRRRPAYGAGGARGTLSIRSRALRIAGAAAVLGLAAGGLRAQPPAAPWRTLETPHFRLHYPAPAEAWVERAARRLEAIRERVAAEVGYAPPEIVDVLVQDPIAAANGAAIPSLGWPRLVLWTTSPPPDSEIGHYGLWSDLLITHEEAHLAHLLRPSRNPLRRALERVVPVGPIPFAAPRWVDEGYATLVEGRLTGSGRPNSDVRAAILRRWAQAGKLPGYAALASDAEAWRGMSMAYLVGSAYLEWLEERAGRGSLRDLWARMTAVESRGFDTAFSGVFGETPSNLYDRFRAELTWRAIEVERRRLLTEGAPDTSPNTAGELWQDLSWSTGAPAISADGKRLALVLRSRNQPARLVVWSTAPNIRAEREWNEAVAKLRARDPQDVPARRGKPLPRKPVHSWTAPDGIDPTAPRFLADGSALLFVRFEPDGEGVLHPDLSLWTLATGEVRRLTRGADLRDPDPACDGRWAIAVRERYGQSQLVRVDLASGAVEALTQPSVDLVYDRPRLAPDDRRAAYAVHRDGRWWIEILDLASGEAHPVPEPALPQADLSAPAWSADGATLYAVGAQGGMLDLYALPLAGGAAPRQLTWTAGAALAPAPTPDGRGLFFLSLEPDGLDLRRVDLIPSKLIPSKPAQGAPLVAEREQAPAAGSAISDKLAQAPPGELPAGTAAPAATAAPQTVSPPLPRDLAPAIAPARGEAPPPYAETEIGMPRPYGLGRQEAQWFAGFSGSSSGGAWEAGARSGDVLGRLDLLALGAGATGGQARGGALAGAWRGLPVELRFHLFRAEERPNGDRSRPLASDLPGSTRQGIEIGGAWIRHASAGWLALEGGLLWNEIEDSGGASVTQRLAALRGASRLWHRKGKRRLEVGADAHFEAGDTGGGWQRYGGGLDLSLRQGKETLGLAWRRDGSRHLRTGFDAYQLGGPEPSVLPPTALASRLVAPGLPLALLTGTGAEEQRAELKLSALPAPLFFARYRLWDDGSPHALRREWLALSGLEFELRMGPQPIVRLPAFSLRAGVAKVVSTPDALSHLAGDWRWWVVTAWRP